MDHRGASFIMVLALAACVERPTAPSLFYTPGDDIRREPRWVADMAAGEQVRIAYLPSYYRDTGSKGFEPGYDSHNGDCELIVLTVYYDWSTSHWVLDHALYSQHGSLVLYDRGTDAYPYVLEYPIHAGAYPRTWVAEGKHANYAHQNECNNGVWGNDTCEDNTAAIRVEAGASLNIGGRLVHSTAQDCMVSSNPLYEFYGAGRVECYWTWKRFRGWVPDSVGGGDASAYSDVLASAGF